MKAAPGTPSAQQMTKKWRHTETFGYYARFLPIMLNLKRVPYYAKRNAGIMCISLPKTIYISYTLWLYICSLLVFGLYRSCWVSQNAQTNLSTKISSWSLDSPHSTIIVNILHINLLYMEKIFKNNKFIIRSNL
jgi:hypothetical protein